MSFSDIAQEWEKLNGARSDLLDRCEKYAGWTLPMVMPAVQTGSPPEEQLDYQALGAQSVNHLANKLVFALFNPSKPFFKLVVDEEYKADLATKGVDEVLLTQVLSKAEKEAPKGLLKRRFRANLVLAMKHLVITGSALFYVPPDSTSTQVYSLRDYVLERDVSGRVIKLITRDMKKKASLPPELQEYVATQSKEADLSLYTRVTLVDNKYEVEQALDTVPIESVSGSWSKEECPWIPLSWDLPRGWTYGVGLVEQYGGTFHSMSILTEALVKAGVVAADIKFLVDPTGITDYNALNNASTGEYIAGREGDITVLQLGKERDLRTTVELLDKLERRIGRAFLLNSAVTRDSERTTAAEIRVQAQELETSLGGVYSTLADDFQTPLAYLALKEVDFNVSGKKISPLIITGMDALSRETDADSMMLFLEDLARIAQVPPELLGRIDPDKVSRLLAANRGIDYDSFMKSQQQIQQEQQQMQMQQQQQGMQEGTQ